MLGIRRSAQMLRVLIIACSVLPISDVVPNGMLTGAAGAATSSLAATTVHATSSTWYWQNPLPRAYSVTAIACHSLTACLAVGDGALVLTTNDGGRHWIERPSGSTIGLQRVTCPGPAMCYALGSDVSGQSSIGQPPTFKNVILRSGDGGRTWQQPSPQLPTDTTQTLTDLVCPTVNTCLVAGSNYAPQGKNPLLRTTDSGKTWQSVNLPRSNSVMAVTCTATTVCYEWGTTNSGSVLARSFDSGKTWKTVGLSSPRGYMSAMACPTATTCFAADIDCGAECNMGHIYVTGDGARTWKQLYQVDGMYQDTTRMTCPSATTCYASAHQSVVRTTSSGKTWSVRRLPDELTGGLACPSPTTCYLTALSAVLKTSDSFGHTRETLAHSVIRGESLTAINCPSTAFCLAAGSRNVCPPAGSCDDVSASFAATTDGGKTWRTTPTTPDLLYRLSCLREGVCLAIGGSNPTSIAVDRTNDGGGTWHQMGWQQIDAGLGGGPAWDIACVATSTCYLLATIAQHIAVFVTHDTGNTWSVQTGIDPVARAGGTDVTTTITPSRISCPSSTTCFVLASVTAPSPGHLDQQVVLLSTTDGGASWTRHLTVPGAVPSNRYPPLGNDLSCPTTTTCYLLSYSQNPEAGNPNGVPGPVLVTHDAGATWQSRVVSSGEGFIAITCTTAQNCRVAGSTIFATTDGGFTWQRELMADGSPVPPVLSIACPAVETCYGVGGLAIVATHTKSEWMRSVTHREATSDSGCRSG